ncbi:CAP domain-containing protein [Paenisporosarcina sp. TG-14]|uniref:CAP domain-containing protein n=1 Tax=Paenisporosarcina sp. TG-14 TaxID=1231057 RepID=UPI003FCD825D
MGVMVFSFGQVITAEASSSQNAENFLTQATNNWTKNTQSKQVESYTASQQQMLEEIYAQLAASGLNFDFEKFVAEKQAATAKPVAEKPAATAKPAAEKTATTAKPAAEKTAATAKPVAEKPAATAKPVAEKPATQATEQAGSISNIEQQVLTLTNQERAKEGLKALATDAKLMNAAREKSTDMRTNKYFSHTSPTFGSPFDRMKALGIDYRAAGENIAMGQKSAEEVVKAWMESPGHRENIMKANFTHIGIGYDAQGHYWTQQFIQK